MFFVKRFLPPENYRWGGNNIWPYPPQKFLFFSPTNYMKTWECLEESRGGASLSASKEEQIGYVTRQLLCIYNIYERFLFGKWYDVLRLPFSLNVGSLIGQIFLKWNFLANEWWEKPIGNGDDLWDGGQTRPPQQPHPKVGHIQSISA